MFAKGSRINLLAKAAARMNADYAARRDAWRVLVPIIDTRKLG